MNEAISTYEIESILKGIEPTMGGIEKLIADLGYPILDERKKALDKDILLQQKDLRERVSKINKLFSIQAQWIHPESKQTFDREANTTLFELKEEKDLYLRWPFDITRYIAKFASPPFQGIFFFIAPGAKAFVITAYSRSLTEAEKIEVRRLIVEIENITRTDKEAIWGLKGLSSEPKTTIQRFREALPHLKVGREFFQEYHAIFQTLTKRLKGILASEEEIYGFSQKLLGKITFLYFLQRKGWLNNDKAYLKNRRKKLDAFGVFDLFYDIFEKLNTEGISDPKLGHIPFLNGTLFEPDVFTKNERKKIRKTCAPILPKMLDILDSYNFTISESTPLDKEVAVDPELLGSIFESMLPETERGDKGTFYTHQEDMIFMAKEAIRAQLSNFSDILSSDQIFYVVYNTPLKQEGKIEPKMAREVKERLQSIKILDPAVGSCGFLMASLQVLMEIRHRLNGIIGTKEQDYDIKLEIIEKNLFGIDIEYEAIELARLRLWLSLVVDEALENVRPLPNFDYNLHQGDSLRIPDFEKGWWQTNLIVDPTIRKALMSEIQTTREKFINSHGKNKEEMKRELEDALAKLLNLETGQEPQRPLPFSYRYFFPDVMAEGGFDIILMNPPYIRQEDIGRLPGQDPDTYKDKIAEGVQFLTAKNFKPAGQSDISIYFHVRTLTLLKNEGVAIVIASSKWLDVKYGVPLQEYLLENIKIEYVFDSVDRSFSADVNTVITVMRKGKENIKQNIVHFVYFKRAFKDVTPSLLRKISEIRDPDGLIRTPEYRITTRNQKKLYEDGLELEDTDEENKNKKQRRKKRKTEGKYVGTKWGNLHLYAPDVFFEILERGNHKVKRLSEIKSCYIKRGFTTGCDAFFILNLIQDKKRKGHFFCENGLGHTFWLEKEFCYPVIKNPDDISSYIQDYDTLQNSIFFCRKSRKELRGTEALNYIKWGETSSDAFIEVIRGKDKGKKIRVCETSTVKSRPEWYQLADIIPSRLYLPKLVKNRPLIVCSDSPLFSGPNQYAFYCDKKSEEDYWLFFSSAIFRLFMELQGTVQGAGALAIMAFEYRQIPILDPMPKIAEKFKLLGDFKRRSIYRIVNIKEPGPLELEQESRKQLDNIVLQLMGFKDDKERERILENIYKWITSRTKSRLEKPKHAPKSISKASKAKQKGIQIKLEGIG